MTCQEVRFIPVRFKDAYGPVGAWFLLFKSRATTALGGDYMQERRPELDKWAPYGLVKPVPANLRNWLMMLDQKEGKGPAFMRTEEAIQKIVAAEPDEKERRKRLREVESEAWEDFLDMTISQAILWAGTNTFPEESPSEIQACEPYFIGSHSGASGTWVSGPEDLAPPEYFWGYNRMATVKGIFCAGDASGASSHKFSDGSHVEARIAAKAALAYCKDNTEQPKIDDAKVAELKERILRPLNLYEEHSGETDNVEVNENYISPRQFMYRLQKIMDEYAGGAATMFATNQPYLERGLELLEFLKEDSEKLAAGNLHELMRCWENVHRMWQAEAHVRSVLFREETRWPGYYFRADKPAMDDKNWKVFVNCKWDPAADKWEVFTKPIIQIVD
jgi:adenylylsulfate reductase subunit A